MMDSKSPPRRFLPNGYMPNETDILCARGKASAKHSGNKVFMAVLHSNMKTYSEASTRIEKSAVITNVLECVTWAGLRFLKYDTRRGQYFVCSSDSAYEKVGNSMRDLLRHDTKKPAAVSSKAKEESTSRKKQISDGLSDEITWSPCSSTNASEDAIVEPLHHGIDWNEPVASMARNETTTNTTSLDVESHALRINKSLFSFSNNASLAGEYGELGVELPKIPPAFRQRDTFDLTPRTSQFHDSVATTHCFPANRVKEENDSPLPLDSKEEFESKDIEILEDLLADLDTSP